MAYTRYTTLVATRSPCDQGVTLLINCGVRLLTAGSDDLTASDDPSHKMMRQIAGAFAEYEYEKARVTLESDDGRSVASARDGSPTPIFALAEAKRMRVPRPAKYDRRCDIRPRCRLPVDAIPAARARQFVGSSLGKKHRVVGSTGAELQCWAFASILSANAQMPLILDQAGLPGIAIGVPVAWLPRGWSPEDPEAIER